MLKSCQGNLNLITQALEAVGCKMEVIPDPTTVHFHLPNNLSVRVHREYSEFITELISKFPQEKQGILKFYSECWKVCFNWGDCNFLWVFFPLLMMQTYIKNLYMCLQIFNALNSLELKSLEEPIYLFGQFFKKPLECLTLGRYSILAYSFFW